SVGGEGHRAQAALLPHHGNGEDGAQGKTRVVEGIATGRRPHSGEIRWTSLSTTSIRSAAASADRGLFGSTFAGSCANIYATPWRTTRRPAYRRRRPWTRRSKILADRSRCGRNWKRHMGTGFLPW